MYRFGRGISGSWAHDALALSIEGRAICTVSYIDPSDDQCSSSLTLAQSRLSNGYLCTTIRIE